MDTVEKREVPAKFLGALDPAEQPRFAAFPSYTTVVAGHHWDNALLLLTDRRLLVLRSGLLGKPKIAQEATWDRVQSVSAQLWNGGGPKIQILITTDRTFGMPIELIVEPHYADAVEAAIRSGYRSSRESPPNDPGALAAWMQAKFDHGDYREVWEQRLELGLGLTRGEMSSTTWFWVNAYPALAALRAEVRWVNPAGEYQWHPLVSTCAAYADEVYRELGPDEAAANAEIAQRFFG